MPIHLPPLSRRQFLAGSLATGAGLLLPRQLAAGETAGDPHRFALLADIHVWQQRSQAHNGVRPAENFERVRSEILGVSPLPSKMIVSGDRAIREGQAGDYRVLADLVRPIRQAGLGLHLLLGNHDHRGNILEAFPEAKPKANPAVPEKHVAIVETERANWFLLDSMERTNSTPGSMGQAQLDWLRRELDARPDKPALVLAHHQPDRAPKTDGLQDTAALMEVLVPRKQVKAYLFGHTHRWGVAAVNGLHLVNLPTTVWVFDKVSPQGWVDARLRTDGISLTLNALDKKHAANGKTVDLKWRS